VLTLFRKEEGTNAPIMLNVMQDRDKMPQPKPKAVAKENQPPKGARKTDKKEAKREAKEVMQAKQLLERTGWETVGNRGDGNLRLHRADRAGAR